MTAGLDLQRLPVFLLIIAGVLLLGDTVALVFGSPSILRSLLVGFATVCGVVAFIKMSPPVRASALWAMFVFCWIVAGVGSASGPTAMVEVWGTAGFLLLITATLYTIVERSVAIDAKLRVPYSVVRGGTIAFLAFAGAFSMWSGVGQPEIRVPPTAVNATTGALVELQQSTGFAVDRFDEIVQLVSIWRPIQVRWRMDALLELALALLCAYAAARALGVARTDAVAVASVFGFGAWSIEELQFALLPLWCAPLTFAIAARGIASVRAVLMILCAIIFLVPSNWLSLVVLGVLRAVTDDDNAKRYRLPDRTTIALIASGVIALIIQLILTPPVLEDGLLLPARSASVIALLAVAAIALRGAQHRKALIIAGACVLIAAPLVATHVLAGSVGSFGRAFFSEANIGLLLGAGFFGFALLLVRLLRTSWTEGNRLSAGVLLFATLSSVAVPVANPTRFRVDDSQAYRRLAVCKRGDVADFPVPGARSIEDRLYTLAAGDAGHRDDRLPETFRASDLSSLDAARVAREHGIRYLVVHFNDARVSAAGDLVDVPTPAAFSGLRLLDSSTTGTWLYGTEACT